MTRAHFLKLSATGCTPSAEHHRCRRHLIDLIADTRRRDQIRSPAKGTPAAPVTDMALRTRCRVSMSPSDPGGPYQSIGIDEPFLSATHPLILHISDSASEPKSRGVHRQVDKAQQAVAQQSADGQDAQERLVTAVHLHTESDSDQHDSDDDNLQKASHRVLPQMMRRARDGNSRTAARQ